MWSAAAYMLCSVQGRGRGQWLPAEEQLLCQVAPRSCQLARLLALMTRPPCQHPAHRRTAQQRPPINSASAARPGKDCAPSMPLRCIVLHMGMLKGSAVSGGRKVSRPGLAGRLARRALRAALPERSPAGAPALCPWPPEDPQRRSPSAPCTEKTFGYLQSTSCSVHCSPAFKFCSTKKEKVGSSLAPEPCRRRTAAA